MQGVRECLLQVIAEHADGGGALQSAHVLDETYSRFGRRKDQSLEQAILTAYYDLFRTGYLAWGQDIRNADPPHFHLTELGRKALATLSRDPGNPDGYLNVLSRSASLNPIADSYIREALACFVHDLPKAAAVMVGCASESMAVELRDAITARLQTLNHPFPPDIDDWRIKRVLDSMQSFFSQNTSQMSRQLRDSFAANWSAFLHQIRSARNDAGHPSSVDPVTFETVHGSLLIFPELARLTGQLIQWVSTDYR
jgi:hypothetical protein